MTTSRTGAAWTSDPSQLSRKQVGYYRARLRSRVHQLVLGQYRKLEEKGLTRAELARRLHKRPEVITRLLGAPGNWTLDTISDLLLGMGYEPDLSLARLGKYARAPSADIPPQLASVHTAKVLPGVPTPQGAQNSPGGLGRLGDDAPVSSTESKLALLR